MSESLEAEVTEVKAGDRALDDFEQRLNRLEEIVKDLEDGKLPLQQGMDLYKEGIECANACRELLKVARHKLTVWRRNEAEPLELDQLQINQS